MEEKIINESNCKYHRQNISNEINNLKKDLEELQIDYKSNKATVNALDKSYCVLIEKLSQIEDTLKNIKNWFARGVVMLSVSGIGGLIAWIVYQPKH